MAIRLLTPMRIAGVVQAADAIVTLPTVGEEADLVADRVAVWSGANLTAPWVPVPGIFRLRITGTGTVQLDARNGLGVETLAVETWSVTSATNEIVFPYAGDDATHMRISASGTATVEVLA
jgi:hypothetical protein